MFYIVLVIVQGIIFGFATKTVIENKGYDENWFWWGFWFGLIALIVACAKPQIISSTTAGSNSQSTGYYNYTSAGCYTKESDIIRNRETLNAGGWQCPCGRVNASYVSTCACGANKADVKNLAYKKEEERKESEAKKEAEAKMQAEIRDETAKVSAIKGYKELLDSGIISQEEFEAKKKQLMGL